MRADIGLLAAVAAAVLCLSPPNAAAGEAGWKFSVDERDHPYLAYSEGGTETFSVGCGRAFGIRMRYPAETRRKGPAEVVISSGSARMALKGELDVPDSGDGPSEFLQWDLGYRRQDPELFGRKWEVLQARFFALLDSGRPLTVSAENKRYVLPPVGAPDWRARFEAHC